MSEDSDNSIISKLALLQVYYALSIGQSMRRKIASYVLFLNCVTTVELYTIFYCESEPELYKPVMKYFLLERTQIEAFQFI